MMTVGEQGGMILPVGEGMGATQEAKATMSPARAAGRLPISTVADPLEITPGPPGTQLGSMHGPLMLVATAAGMLLISTVGTVALMMVSGIGGCASGVGTGAGGWMGAWQCGPSWMSMSPWRAAPGM